MTAADRTPMHDRQQPDRAVVLRSKRVRVVDDPLTAVMLGRLRDRRTTTWEFAAVSEKIALRLLWATLDDITIRPGVATGFDGNPVAAPELAERVAGVVILRAGLLFVSPFRAVMPDAPIYQIGMRRDEDSLDAELYASNLPDSPNWADRILVLDPMIATGGSAQQTVAEIRHACAGQIDVVSVIAAPLGVDALLRADSGCRIFTAALDDALNDQGYIVPGLGDAGDRLFGTQAQSRSS